MRSRELVAAALGACLFVAPGAARGRAPVETMRPGKACSRASRTRR